MIDANGLAQQMLLDQELGARYPYRDIPSEPLSERFAAIRWNYRQYQCRVDVGARSWLCADPYEVADWARLFTPIEAAAWGDIRAAGLPLWPQLPVGRFFLDFGNPVVKVALECDGRKWHDGAKDAARDAWVSERGWTVYRAPGWRCMADTERAERYEEVDAEDRSVLEQIREEQTMVGIIRDLRRHFDGSLA